MPKINSINYDSPRLNSLYIGTTLDDMYPSDRLDVELDNPKEHTNITEQIIKSICRAQKHRHYALNIA